MIKLNTYKSNSIALIIACTCLIISIVVLINNHHRMIELEKKRVRINKELHEIQVTYERRQKEYYEKAKQQRAELERMRKEIIENK